MRTVIRYVLITALRDRLFVGVLAAIILATAISATLAATSMIEVREMTLAFAAAASRLILILGLVVFVAFHIRHAFDNREVDVFLSRPISRSKLVLSYWVAFSVVAVVVTLLTILVVYVVGAPNPMGFAVWSGSLLLEALLMVAFTLFGGLILKSGVMVVLTSFGFYVLSRMMGFFLATMGGRTLFESTMMNNYARYTIDALAVLVPRLDFFAKSRWLSYGIAQWPSELLLFVGQTAVFVPLLLTAAMIDFKRKQF